VVSWRDLQKTASHLRIATGVPNPPVFPIYRSY
jgi:hypothetical protein